LVPFVFEKGGQAAYDVSHLLAYYAICQDNKRREVPVLLIVGLQVLLLLLLLLGSLMLGQDFVRVL
jgi:predicted membrane protein